MMCDVFLLWLSLSLWWYCSTVRNTKFIHILGQYGALGTVFATRVKELWTNFLGSMGLTETVRCVGVTTSIVSCVWVFPAVLVYHAVTSAKFLA